MQVAVNELKASLSHYLNQAQAGEVIEVTSHRRTIARILGVAANQAPGVGRMLAEGMLTWDGGKPEFDAPSQLTENGTSVSRIVMEDRG